MGQKWDEKSLNGRKEKLRGQPPEECLKFSLGNYKQRLLSLAAVETA
jgi:hypothetical protein